MQMWLFCLLWPLRASAGNYRCQQEASSYNGKPGSPILCLSISNSIRTKRKHLPPPWHSSCNSLGIMCTYSSPAFFSAIPIVSINKILLSRAVRLKPFAGAKCTWRKNNYYFPGFSSSLPTFPSGSRAVLYFALTRQGPVRQRETSPPFCPPASHVCSSPEPGIREDKRPAKASSSSSSP